MALPGAKRSTQRSWLENAARASVAVLDATVSASGVRAGDCRRASVLPLPAATTTVNPASTSRATAVSKVSEATLPRLMLTTPGRCPWAGIQSVRVDPQDAGVVAQALQQAADLCGRHRGGKAL